MRTLLSCLAVLFLSCQNNPSSVNELFQENSFPIEVISKSKMIHTEEGKIKLEIFSEKIERYSGEVSELKFSEGFNVNFYSKSGKIISNLSALNAIVDEKNNIMTAKDSVILKNNEKKLETEVLIWDEKKDKIYTESDVIITTKNEIIYAQGFISDPNFSDYTLKNISGKMYLDSPKK